MHDERRHECFLEGPRLMLRGLDESDVEGPYVGWLNDEVVCAGNSHHVRPYGRAQALEYVRSARGSHTELVLAMVRKADGRHIGNIALSRIHAMYARAEFSVLLGDREAWGQGFGLEGGRLLLRHGFEAMNLRRIECGTFAENRGMRKLALALGMREEGVRREAAWKDGRYVDVVEYGVLREEFRRSAQ